MKKNTKENSSKITKSNEKVMENIINTIKDFYENQKIYEIKLKYIFSAWYLYKHGIKEVDMKAVTKVDQLLTNHHIYINLNTPYKFCEDVFISYIMTEIPEQVKDI